MIGIEFVQDQKTKEGAQSSATKVIEMCFERGLLVLGCGPNTIRLCPPLIITEEQADFATGTIEDCLKSLL